MSQFVMVVDDSTTGRKILEVCLHRAGYEVRRFADGTLADAVGLPLRRRVSPISSALSLADRVCHRLAAR